DSGNVDVTSNYTITPVNFLTGTINPKPLHDIFGSATYNGTTTFTAAESTFNTLGTGNGVVGSDVVTINGGSLTVPNKNVNTYTTSAGLNVSGLTLSNSDYVLDTSASANNSFSVLGRQITISAVNNTKTYDGNTSSINISQLTSGSLAPGDTGAYSQLYSTPSAGINNKTLIPSVIITDSGNVDVTSNYTITPVNFLTGTINPKPLHDIFGSATYNGTTTFTAAESTFNTLGAGNGVVGSDVVTINGGSLSVPNRNVN